MRKRWQSLASQHWNLEYRSIITFSPARLGSPQSAIFRSNNHRDVNETLSFETETRPRQSKLGLETVSRPRLHPWIVNKPPDKIDEIDSILLVRPYRSTNWLWCGLNVDPCFVLFRRISLVSGGVETVWDNVIERKKPYNAIMKPSLVWRGFNQMAMAVCLSPTSTF